MRVGFAVALVVGAADCRSPAPTVVTVVPVASAPTTRVGVRAVGPEAAAPWPDARRAVSADGSFALEYPANTFKRPTAQASSIALSSDVSEPSWRGAGGDDLVYSIELTKLASGIVAALGKELDAKMFHERFPDGTEASFKPEPGFLARAGPHDYVLSRGVEGTGDRLHVFATKGGTFRFDCTYCCGMVEKPKMTKDAQLALCDDVLRVFQEQQR